MITFKYRLYRNDNTKYLDRAVDISGIIWNSCVALQRRYYRLTGKYIHKFALMKHIAKRKKLPRYAFWKLVDAQATQEIVERLDKSYQAFFKYQKTKTVPERGKPGFRKVKEYRSFTLKQTGWKLLGGNKVKILGRVYKFAKSREIEQAVKTLTVKRDELGNFWVCFVMDGGQLPTPATSGRAVGMDFGLKQFLSFSDDSKPIESPQFFKQGMKRIARLNKELSRKAKGSQNRKDAKRRLAQAHIDIANQRKDWFFKLAHELTDRYDFIFLEDLNIQGMKKLWGRKVSDLGFASFVEILQWVALKKGKVVGFVNRYFPSTKLCSACGYKNNHLGLSDRTWTCPDCGTMHDRDGNAAENICREGMSSLGLAGVRPALAGDLCLSLESHWL